MSKPVKEMMRQNLSRRLQGVDSLALVDFTGVDATATNQIRGRLAEKSIHMMVVKNSLARQAFRDAGLEQAGRLLRGPCAIAYGDDSETVGVVSVVRELLDIRKEQPNLGVKAALLEGEVFGSDRVEELSEYPTREEAIGRITGSLMAPAANLSAALLGGGSTLVGILKSIEEKQGGDESAEQAA
ncbi:MAG: 50S ribosomal protein L10 [Planctomycetota bacterium]